MIDLHIHTTSSDGTVEPEVILIKAQQIGLSYISITDHDTIGAYEKINKNKRIRSNFKGKIISGCEFSVAHNGKPIEILGYGIDLDTIKTSGIVLDEKFIDRENEYLRKMVNVCKSLGISHSKNLSIKNARFFATQVMHADFKKYPENKKHLPRDVWGSVNAFYRTCVNNEESPFYINQIKDYPTIPEATSLIGKAGGKSFLAHPYGYLVNDENKFLDSIVSLNALDGIECFHSLHSIEKTQFILNYCKEHNLFASGGSDYHGEIKPTVKIGESISGVKIPFEILEPWLPINMM